MPLLDPGNLQSEGWFESLGKQLDLIFARVQGKASK